jgi:hypothetical protein
MQRQMRTALLYFIATQHTYKYLIKSISRSRIYLFFSQAIYLFFVLLSVYKYEREREKLKKLDCAS